MRSGMVHFRRVNTKILVEDEKYQLLAIVDQKYARNKEDFDDEFSDGGLLEQHLLRIKISGCRNI